MLEKRTFKTFLFYSSLDMEAGRQQDGLSHEKRIVQRSRSRRLRSTGKATERQAAGKFGIPRLVEFKLLPSDSLKYRVRKSLRC